MQIPELDMRGSECPPSLLLKAIRDHGVALLRHPLQQLADFLQVSEQLGKDFLGTQTGAGPHKPVGSNLGRTPVPGYQGLFVSTSPSLKKALPLHGELFFQGADPPELLWFYCKTAPLNGGETLLCDGRELYQALPEAVQAMFHQQRIVYARQLRPADWPQVFGCNDQVLVQQFLQEQGLETAWAEDGTLHTRFVTSALRQWQGQWVFINNVLPFALREIEEPQATQARVRFENGQSLPVATVNHINQLAHEFSQTHRWQAGDILVIHNRCVLHGRDQIDDTPRELWLRISFSAFDLT